MSSYKFIPGLELNRSFYFEVIEKLLKKDYPDLKYSAGIIGYGSDTLGVDTEISMDHEWGPRLYIFLHENDYNLKDELDNYFKEKLPYEFKGFPTNFTSTENEGIRRMKPTNEGLVNHHIDITSFERFLEYTLGSSKEIRKPIEFLTNTEQGLIEVTNGKLFRDDLNIEIKRSKYRAIPKDITRIKLAALWNAISSEEAFVGRNFDVGDFVGGKIIAMRHLNHLMKISFCLEEKYIPYSKWISTIFWKLKISEKLKPLFNTIASSNNGKEICNALVEAYLVVLQEQNKKCFTEKIELQKTDYYGRPYEVIFTEKIVEGLVNSIDDSEIKGLNINAISMVISNNGIDFTDQLNNWWSINKG